MAFSLKTILATQIIKKIVDTSIDNALEHSTPVIKTEILKFRDALPESLETHMIEIANWCATIPFAGMSKPKATDGNSVELAISSDLSRYSSRKRNNFITEHEVLFSQENYLIIGHPGAGKTTTLKRLLIQYFNRQTEEEVKYAYPILVRLREIPNDGTVYKAILDKLGIEYHSKVIERERLVKNETGEHEIKIVKRIEGYVGDQKMSTFLPKFLNASKAILFLDGIDELNQAIKNSCISEIQALGIKASDYKVITTIRKGDFDKIYDNFNILEIRPLTAEKIRNISDHWLDEGVNFINELDSKPYKDLADRPIFLTLLLILFDRNGFLPLSPSEVYEHSTTLVLSEWDTSRGIKRISNYSKFNVSQKLKFLYEVAFEITYISKLKSFKHSTLMGIYKKIHNKYDLPLNQMNKVIQEIESHNGILYETVLNTFEFSHLSIQEYLCAEYIVRMPFSQATINYFYEYPEPLAVAACISGAPGIWLSNLVLNSNLNINRVPGNKAKLLHGNTYKLFSRLLIESPSFDITDELGFTVIYLLFNFYNYRDENDTFNALIDVVLEYPKVKESLTAALKYYNPTQYTHYNSRVRVRRVTKNSTDYFLDLPLEGILMADIYKKYSGT